MKRGVSAWWNKISIFGKTYLMSLMLTASVVILGETSEYSASFFSGFAYWPATAEQQEVVIWLLVILIAGLAGGYIFSRLTTRPLQRLQIVVKELAGGNLEARLKGPDLQRSDEIGQLARGFNLMADNFKRTLDNEQRLMWDISHEMRSPMARLKIALALLEKKSDSTTAAAEYLAQMDKDITELDETAELLLAKTRLEAGQMMEKSRFDSARLIAESVRSFSFPSLGEGKNIACENIEKPLMILGNRQGLRRVIDNLLKNALYYTAPNTTVNVSLKQNHREIILEITDQGPGLPEDHLPHIFRPFYRVDASRDRGSGGLGLGLSIARQVVDDHNGQIWAVNAGGEGSRQGLKVVVTLPKH